MGHSPEVFQRTYVKPHRDARERERIREALLRIGLGVPPTCHEPDPG
jgi:hypothetical protein